MLAGHSIIFKPQILQLSDEAALQGPALSSPRMQHQDCLPWQQVKRGCREACGTAAPRLHTSGHNLSAEHNPPIEQSINRPTDGGWKLKICVA